MVDPNVWIAAVINPFGAPAAVAEAVADGTVAAVVSQHLLDAGPRPAAITPRTLLTILG